MKILIQARKYGFNVLFPIPTPTEFYQFAGDIQSASAKNDAIYYGINFYTLAFENDGCIFTKYVIGYDIDRENLGNVGISIFIPNTKKLSGNNVKVLLDKLLNTYCRNYCPDYYISNMREDWLLFTSLANTYDAELLSTSSNYNNITKGGQEPAFHYYKSDSELIEHLDKPFQEEYNGYKQILFIDSNLKSNANPLNVLKNSGAEVNPDFLNEYFYLQNYKNSQDINITANGMPRSDKSGENIIRAKWRIEIKYSKDDRSYEPIIAKGTISDLTCEIHKYIEIKGNNIMIDYSAFNNPTKRKKSIPFEIKDQNGKSIEGAEIQIFSKPIVKVISSATIIDFHGEEIINQWKVSAKKESENLYSNTISVVPDSQIGSIVLTLQKQKAVKIFVVDNTNGNHISNFKIWCNDGKGYRENVSEIFFIGDEINKTWCIEVSKKEGRDYYLGKIEYCPATGNNPLYVPCQKTGDLSLDSKTSKIDEGEHEKKIYFYQNPKFIAGLIVGIIVLTFSIWALYSLFGKDKEPIEIPLSELKIELYVEGDSLIASKLNEYRENWERQEQNFIDKSGGIFGGEENVDSSRWVKEWKPVYESIGRAIKIRELINNKNIEELRKQHYTNNQLFFKTAIEKTDSNKYQEVHKQLGDVSALTLTQIAKKINKILEPKEPAKEETQQEVKKEENIPVTKNEASKKNEKTQEQKTVANNNTSEIIQYLKGSDLKKETLKKYLENAGENTTLKASLNLCLKLWSLNGARNNSYYTYLEDLNKDPNLKVSDLKNFVSAMCNEEKPKYIKELPDSDQIKSLSHIKSKLQ